MVTGYANIARMLRTVSQVCSWDSQQTTAAFEAIELEPFGLGRQCRGRNTNMVKEM